MLFRNVFALALVSVVFANPFGKRQGTDTNAQILPPLDTLASKVGVIIPEIQLLQVSHQANDTSIGAQIEMLIAAWNTTASALSGIPPSIGSNTTTPTDNDLAVSLGDSLSKVTSGLSALTPAIVPDINTLLTSLDGPIAATVDAFNASAPAQSSTFVHILMLDARQFFADENMTQTLAALGF
ncbi:uncharacterized protein C8R40DRAFT_385580 [Lentinula edodes]|uniref:uncharacterized protein n=1 Tax=Lentinula edodes TaxID=5353 RepID=UPI001BF8A190|nr:uncharacterized protein C8R40DRAFT_385580 [Lentinula edodes]KAF8824954.1 hypothetical protein HHX47_DHR7000521 [Lentinula edodes]KAH7873391.1 hypothetical protein C8R40DRAFT_385580 [Lentinula edodes]KAJ3921762.1 hypothetical protein F5877DRAFT_64670 [Lentinula edodes]